MGEAIVLLALGPYSFRAGAVAGGLLGAPGTPKSNPSSSGGLGDCRSLKLGCDLLRGCLAFEAGSFLWSLRTSSREGTGTGGNS